MIIKKIALVLLGISLLSSCSKANDDVKEKQQINEYIARVDRQFISHDDILKRLDAVPEYARSTYEGEEGIRTIVDELIKTELLYLQAKKIGLDKDADYVSKVVDYKKFALVSLLFERKITSRIQVTEKEARDYYNENKANFTLPQQIKASHILVKDRSEAEKILKELRKGKNFESIAKERSIDKNSAENGGDLGYFTKGEMVPEFETVAFSLKRGRISDPVKSQYGYHIIKVTDRKEGETVAFSKVKDLIIQRVEQEKQQLAFNEYINEIKEQYSVETNEEMLSEFIKNHYADKAEPTNN